MATGTYNQAMFRSGSMVSKVGEFISDESIDFGVKNGSIVLNEVSYSVFTATVMLNGDFRKIKQCVFLSQRQGALGFEVLSFDSQLVG